MFDATETPLKGMSAATYAAWLLAAAVLAAVVVLIGEPLIVLACAALLMVAALALLAPTRGTVVVVVLGSLTPFYVLGVLPVVAATYNGLYVFALLLVVCGIGMTVRYGFERAAIPFAVAAGALMALWFAAPFWAHTTDAGMEHVAAVVAMSVAEVVAGAGALLVCGTRRGRDTLLRALSIAGVVSVALAAVEFSLQRNPILEFALRYHRGGEEWTLVPERFGLVRAAVAFGHPILLGSFLGAAMIATLELARRRLLREGVAIGLVALMFVGQLMTISRGPIVATIAALAVWALLAFRMQAWRRVALIAVVVGCVGLTIAQLVVATDLASFVTPSQTELGETSQHRVTLVERFVEELSRPTAFGLDSSGQQAVLRDFGYTIDHEGLWVLMMRGLVGLATIGVLVIAPAAIAVFRTPGRWQDKLLPLVMPLYLLLVGSTVAFFGSWLTFTFVVLALTWSTLADSTAGRQPSAVPDTAPEGLPARASDRYARVSRSRDRKADG